MYIAVKYMAKYSWQVYKTRCIAGTVPCQPRIHMHNAARPASLSYSLRSRAHLSKGILSASLGVGDATESPLPCASTYP